jgi:chromate transport protein ChrA
VIWSRRHPKAISIAVGVVFAIVLLVFGAHQPIDVLAVVLAVFFGSVAALSSYRSIRNYPRPPSN